MLHLRTGEAGRCAGLGGEHPRAGRAAPVPGSRRADHPTGLRAQAEGCKPFICFLEFQNKLWPKAKEKKAISRGQVCKTQVIFEGRRGNR